MKFNPEIHKRRSIRLGNYNYGLGGAYFITIVVQERLCLFGNIVNGLMYPNSSGKMIERIWFELSEKYVGVETDYFVLMPNHIHGIIILNSAIVSRKELAVRNSVNHPQKNLTLPEVVHRFKSWTTKLYSTGVEQQNWAPFPGKLWQRNYYDHIIRNDIDLDRTREYIISNPHHWSIDEEYPENR